MDNLRFGQRAIVINGSNGVGHFFDEGEIIKFVRLTTIESDNGIMRLAYKFKGENDLIQTLDLEDFKLLDDEENLMKVYIVERHEDYVNWDEYDSVVVLAKDEVQAMSLACDFMSYFDGEYTSVKEVTLKKQESYMKVSRQVDRFQN